MEQIFDRLLSAFSFEYMISVILATYFIIKVVEMFNIKGGITGRIKRLITFGVGAVLFCVFWHFAKIPFEVLTASYFAAVFFYDAVIKFLIIKLNIDYKKSKEKC